MIKEKFKCFLMLVLSAFILMAPALYNGYPLVYTDTGTYIHSGMNLSIPFDRPVMYGLFIRFMSFHFSLWPVIFIQCFIVSYVLFLSSRFFINNPGNASRKHIFMMALLVAFTGIGWYAGQLMPDIFTPVAVLCTLMLLFYQRFSYAERFFLALILVFSESVHFSNFIICLLLFVFTFFITKATRLVPTFKTQARFLLCALVIASGIGFSSLTNYSLSGSFKMNQGSHVFLMARMIDNGVLKNFLDEKCATKNYALCSCKDSLPEDSRAFLWDEKSPLYKNGGWGGSAGAYNDILKDILKSPKHMGLFLYRGAFSGFSQLLQNEIGSGLIGPYYSAPASPPYMQIAINFPGELNIYRQSRQNSNLWGQGLDFALINALYYTLLLTCVLFLLLIASAKSLWREISDASRLIAITLIAACVINAFVTAALANVYDRLQSRIGWIFIYIAIIVVLNEHKVIREWLKQKISGNITNLPK